jgi:hypothetical protein
MTIKSVLRTNEKLLYVAAPQLCAMWAECFENIKGQILENIKKTLCVI